MKTECQIFYCLFPSYFGEPNWAIGIISYGNMESVIGTYLTRVDKRTYTNGPTAEQTRQQSKYEMT